MKNNDFKYIMSDLYTLHVGARYNYRELIDSEYVGFKLKALIQRYLLKEVAEDTTLESHLYYMDPADFDCEVYAQLKTKAACSVIDKIDQKTGDITFKEKIYDVKELAAVPAEEKQNLGMVIREIRISKMALMQFTL